MVLVCYI